MNIQYDKLINASGCYMTQSLFYEFRFSTGSEYMPFCLKERDYKGHISVYRVFMECDTEYEAAMILLNSWKHWQVLCNAPWFAKELKKWREEREIREAAIGKAVLIKEAEKGNITAAKSLIDLSGKRKAGRPTKLEIQEEKAKQSKINNKVSSILERMADK